MIIRNYTNLTMNNLIVFDIDGTLIHYIDCETTAYVESINSVIGIDKISTKWDDYSYSTESGILSEIFFQSLQREPKNTEQCSIKDRYISYLSASFKHNPNSLKCIPGARDVFDMAKQINWDVAIATGGWYESAVMKLDTVGIPYHNTPMAHADDHFERKDIIMTAVSRAQHFYNKNNYHNIIYVGDRLWDLKATQALKIDFIGVGEHLKTIENRNFFLVDDYESHDFLNYLKNFESHYKNKENKIMDTV
ncbi:HAD family hydrolase [Legionella cincinnatiensis]|uniref:HAD family hydrolase n=1 Tax=Legionella cincinnatiensis TaxID=28085 RepID=UPI00138F8C0D|nr:HAD family hydrolase [Legionella cincinnatiensis]